MKQKIERIVIIAAVVVVAAIIIRGIFEKKGDPEEERNVTPTVTAEATRQPEGQPSAEPTEEPSPTPTNTPSPTPYSLQEGPTPTPTVTPILQELSPTPTDVPDPTPTELVPTPTKTPREQDEEDFENWMKAYNDLLLRGYRSNFEKAPECGIFVKTSETRDPLAGLQKKRTEYVFDVDRMHVMYDDYFFDGDEENYLTHTVTYTTTGHEEDAVLVWEDHNANWLYDDDTVFFDTTAKQFATKLYEDLAAGTYDQEMLITSMLENRVVMRYVYTTKRYKTKVELALVMTFIDNFAYGVPADEAYRITDLSLYLTVNRSFPDKLEGDGIEKLARGTSIDYMDGREIDHNAYLLPREEPEQWEN